MILLGDFFEVGWLTDFSDKPQSGREVLLNTSSHGVNVTEYLKLFEKIEENGVCFLPNLVIDKFEGSNYLHKRKS